MESLALKLEIGSTHIQGEEGFIFSMCWHFIDLLLFLFFEIEDTGIYDGINQTA